MKYIALILLSVFVLSCNNSKNKDLSAFEKNMQANNHPGKKLMETNCYVCHSPTASHDNRIGPPMVAIKKHYIDNETTKEQFIADMKAWIKNPNEADAKMRGAVRRFGVMPMQAFPEETIEKIADYMYDFEIDQPEWFEDHFNEEKEKHNGNGQGKGMGNGKGMGQGKGKHQQQAQTSYEDLPYGERGLKYALTTKAVLGKNLMGTIQKKGTLEALEFCNVRAYPLTDSMAVVHNASIKRVSDKPRNQKNKANNEELEYIETFKNLLSEKKEINPIVKESGNDVHVYYPIITNTMCLQCHGKIETNIKPDILKSLTLLYPEDKAKGYSENQVRGMWNVSFKKN
ncbi:c-type heme family protein [Winogradskyella poriferorum]|uniref:c-type heme family protein n=1 Tax=Winogradskyella poriferorum TaxID=307627 RepID=UPI003D66071C